MSFAFDPVTAVLIIPVAAAAILSLIPGHRLSSRLNAGASLLTLLSAVLLLYHRPAPGPCKDTCPAIQKRSSPS